MQNGAHPGKFEKKFSASSQSFHKNSTVQYSTVKVVLKPKKGGGIVEDDVLGRSRMSVTSVTKM